MDFSTLLSITYTIYVADVFCLLIHIIIYNVVHPSLTPSVLTQDVLNRIYHLILHQLPVAISLSYLSLKPQHTRAPPRHPNFIHRVPLLCLDSQLSHSLDLPSTKVDNHLFRSLPTPPAHDL